MIGSLRGRITSKTPPQLTVEVGGVGYELEAPMSTFLHLPAVGADVKLLTHFVVREDAQLLYGFATDDERRLFRNLLKVSGIGPKIGLALLSGMSVEAFATCVRNQDVDALIRVPGIGRKTAERMLVEMRDRLAPPSGGTADSLVLQAGAAPEAEAFAALVSLGYRPPEATRLLKAAGPGTHSTEELIRRALQSAAKD
jgi:Holliday junction DNA helicase RuvA